MTFLDLLSYGYVDFQWRDGNLQGLIKNIILICLSKMEVLCVLSVRSDMRVSKW